MQKKRLIILTSIMLLAIVVVSIAKPEWFDSLRLSPQQSKPLPSGITVYAYGANGLVSKQKGSEVSYYHNDNLGSSSLVTDSSGNKVYNTDYYPFGASIHEDGKEKYTYNGKELDNSGLYYYGARYYDASIGRFISVVPVSGNIYNSQRLNRYSYTLNNPLKYVDPTGEEVKRKLVGGAPYFPEFGIIVIGDSRETTTKNDLVIPFPRWVSDLPNGDELITDILEETDKKRLLEVAQFIAFEDLAVIPKGLRDPRPWKRESDINPILESRTLEAFTRARERINTELGIQAFIMDAFRTDKEQRIYRKRNSEAAKILSQHQLGLAIDTIFQRKDQTYTSAPVTNLKDIRRIMTEEGFDYLDRPGEENHFKYIQNQE